MTAVTRPNLLSSAVARQKYAQGVNQLKAEFTGPTTADLGIPGPTRPVSTYDLFVVWHHTAMSTMTPPNQGDRNAAHRGPVFCPWHRFMLRQLELNLQRVLNDQTFGLPYWNWAADGQKSASKQKKSKVWAGDAMGGSGRPVKTGPFRFKSGDPTAFRVRIEANVDGQLVQTNHGLRRTLGSELAKLPNKADTSDVQSLTPYDASPWDTSASGLRNRLEGWAPPSAPALHNRVHVWVGGDMLPSSSPNDPVFYMNHCNVDRIWEAWLQEHGRIYLPPQSAPSFLKGHRINDLMASLVSAPMRPADVLDMTSSYVYDSLAV
jgi:tyrosinase